MRVDSLLPKQTPPEKKNRKTTKRPTGRKPRVATGKQAIQRWKLPVKQARFHQDGHFYNTLESFPAALCDAKGYIIFQTEENYLNCKSLQIGSSKINVKGGKSIADIPGYVLADNPFPI